MIETGGRSRLAERVALLGWALAIGLLGSVPALAFRWAATALPALVWGGGANLVHGVARSLPATRLLVPTAGLALAGLVLLAGERMSRRARGWDILEAVRLRDGVLPLRPTLARAASSLVTVIAAGPVGREGAIVALPAALSSALGGRARVPTGRLRILVGCGAAAGLACAYNTPVGAALFTMEIVFGSFALEVFAPLVVSSATATLLARQFFDARPIFEVPALLFTSTWQMAAVALLGVGGGLLAAAFLGSLRASSSLLGRLRLPRPVALAGVGALVGIAVLRYPEVVGNGREAIADLFAAPFPLGHAAALVLLRLALTPLAVGAGAVGGVFTPTLFLGAMAGNAYGAALSALFPGLAIEPRAFALVGMTALLAGTTHAPLTAVVMVFEMTLDYGAIVPLLLGAAISAIVATTLSRDSVYTEALRRAEGAAGAPAPGLRAADVQRAEQLVVPPDLPLPAVVDRLAAAHRNHAYVVDGAGSFLGAVSLHEAVRLAEEVPEPSRLRASDLADPRFEATFPDEPLDEALERLLRQECERIPVLTDPRSRRLVGTVSKRDILERAVRGRDAVAPSAGPS